MGCGGSLVAKDVVLTAAHCITDIVSTKSTLVTIKRFDLTNTDVGEVIKVKNWIVHPDWNSDKKEFDYALLVLECATTQDIKLVQLNSDENFPLPGALARTMGWGKTEVSDGSDVALKVDTEVISNVECREKLAVSNAKIEDFHICTFKQSKGVCGGDSGEIELSFGFISKPSCSFILSIKLVSGGPLIIPGASPEQDVQIGIVQFGQASCIQQIPDVFARVSNQLGWIKKNVCCASCSETTFVCSSETTFDCSSETTFDCKSSKAAKHAKKM
jgi:secreted trypsin-like serine protease